MNDLQNFSYKNITNFSQTLKKYDASKKIKSFYDNNFKIKHIQKAISNELVFEWIQKLRNKNLSNIIKEKNLDKNREDLASLENIKRNNESWINLAIEKEKKGKNIKKVKSKSKQIIL